jgi:hypothetical protein
VLPDYLREDTHSYVQYANIRRPSFVVFSPEASDVVVKRYRHKRWERSVSSVFAPMLHCQETHDRGNRRCRSRTPVPLSCLPGTAQRSSSYSQVVLGSYAEGMCLERLAGLSPGNSTCRAARLQGTSFETSETGDIGFEGRRNVLAVGTVGIVVKSLAPSRIVERSSGTTNEVIPENLHALLSSKIWILCSTLLILRAVIGIAIPQTMSVQCEKAGV